VTNVSKNLFRERCCCYSLSLSLSASSFARLFLKMTKTRSAFSGKFASEKKEESKYKRDIHIHISLLSRSFCLLKSTISITMGPPAGGGFDTSQIWTSYGGWFADPKHWRRNTAVGFGIVFVSSAYVFNVSRKMEQRPQQPHHRIPSQSWAPEGTFKK